MVQVVLQHSDEMPAAPLMRRMENLALADRHCFKCRFGEPFDPRRLLSNYDVNRILETYEDYEEYFQRSFEGVFDDLHDLSGVMFQQRNRDYFIMINPNHSCERRTLTIAHEFGHLALGHHPVEVETTSTLSKLRFSDQQEDEASKYGIALLIPYAPLLQILRHGVNLESIASHYRVSTSAVEYRLKISGLWEMKLRG